MEANGQEEDRKLNKGLMKLYILLFAVSLATIILSIISSEHKAFFYLVPTPIQHAQVVPACLDTINCT
jgi:cytochrome b561